MRLKDMKRKITVKEFFNKEYIGTKLKVSKLSDKEACYHRKRAVRL